MYLVQEPLELRIAFHRPFQVQLGAWGLNGTPTVTGLGASTTVTTSFYPTTVAVRPGTSLPASVLEFPDGEALAQRLRRHGLSAVSWQPFTFGIATLYVGTKP